MVSGVEEKRRMLMLYDGKCNICNFFVRFTLNRVAADAEINYASLQSAFASKQLAKFPGCEDMGDEKKGISSAAVIVDGKIYAKSQASIQTLKLLYFPWPIFAIVLSIFPTFIADFLYSRFAAWRFVLFGGTDTIQKIPAEKEKLFLDSDEGIHVCPYPFAKSKIN